MAEAIENDLFRKSALSRISSADDLDVFLKVSNPSAWVVVSAFLALIIGLLVWSLTAVVPVRVTTKALVNGDDTARIWVDADLAEKLKSPDARVDIGGLGATNVAVGSRPISSEEIRDTVGQGYLADGLELGEWNFEVNLTFSEAPYGSDIKRPFLAPASVVYAMEHPIELVFGA